MSAEAADRSPGRETVVFVSLSRGLGGPGRSLLSVLAHLDGGLERVLFAPPGDVLSRVRRPWEELFDASREVDITLPGRRGDVLRIYGACDIVLYPSRAESFDRFAVEAMMNGLPVVASDLPAHRELVGEAEAGLLFPVGDAAAAAAAIRRLAGDAELRQRLGTNGRARAARFEPQQVVPQLVAAYRGW